MVMPKYGGIVALVVDSFVRNKLTTSLVWQEHAVQDILHTNLTLLDPLRTSR
jgi:hypothetical protein